MEAGSEPDHLANPTGDGGRQSILRKPAARSDEQAPRPQRRIGGRFVQPGAGLIIENPRGEWIAEDNSAVQPLMDRTIGSRSAGGLTGLSGLHLPSSDR